MLREIKEGYNEKSKILKAEYFESLLSIDIIQITYIHNHIQCFNFF